MAVGWRCERGKRGDDSGVRVKMTARYQWRWQWSESGDDSGVRVEITRCKVR